jgi:predicted NBD/HSP70 family sugar kinase/plasmid maintenance system antidote protein VapI
VVTLSDVALLSGVSTATVSHVINNSKRVAMPTRARVEQAIAQLGFVPNAVARELSLQRTHKEQILEPPTVTMTPAGAFGGEPQSEQAAADSPKMLGLTRATARSMLRIVRATQPISRVDLARRLDVHRSTVTEIVKPLLASGILREGTPEAAGAGRIGRPPIGLSLGPEMAFFIGVNIGVRLTQVGAATTDGQLLSEESFETSPNPAITLKRTNAVIDRICAAHPERAVTSIGVSVPGPTDATRRQLLFAPHLGWHDVAVADALQAGRPAVPVIVENDATAAALYEARRRLRHNTDARNDFVLVRAGTGIGVGLVLGGEVYRGTGRDRGLLGEFGHMTIVAGGKSCACGNRGCWERYASASSASALYAGDRVRLRGNKPQNFVEIVARAEAGELRARATLARTGEYLGIGISNVITGWASPG